MTDPAPAPYGPNTARVRRFLQHAAALTAEEWNDVRRRHAEVSVTTAWVEADYHLGAAVEVAGRAAARDALVPPVLRLAAARGGDEESGAEALLGAVLALVVSDVLDADLRDTLYAPFVVAVPAARLDR